MSYSLRIMAWSVSTDRQWRNLKPTPSAARPEAATPPGRALIYRMHGESAAHRFQELAAQWKADTMNMSSLTEMVAHRAYMGIIGMGERALPFLFDELRREPDHWFTALSAITGQEDLVPDEARGNLDEMTAIWLRWAQQRGY